jgi:hypothetical protein
MHVGWRDIVMEGWGRGENEEKGKQGEREQTKERKILEATKIDKWSVFRSER